MSNILDEFPLPEHPEILEALKVILKGQNIAPLVQIHSLGRTLDIPLKGNLEDITKVLEILNEKQLQEADKNV